MFEVNDVIVYGTQGVCRIAALEEKNISGTLKQYFVLKPVHDTGATVFVPTENAHVLKKMRKVLSEEEINTLIDAMAQKDAVWIPGENERKERYKRMLASGDHLELISMLKGIYAHKKSREAEGKHLHMSDERFFKDAEQMLYNEFLYVLKLADRDALMAYIEARIGSNGNTAAEV